MLVPALGCSDHWHCTPGVTGTAPLGPLALAGVSPAGKSGTCVLSRVPVHWYVGLGLSPSRLCSQGTHLNPQHSPAHGSPRVMLPKNQCQSIISHTDEAFPPFHGCRWCGCAGRTTARTLPCAVGALPAWNAAGTATTEAAPCW